MRVNTFVKNKLDYNEKVTGMFVDVNFFFFTFGSVTNDLILRKL